MAALKELKPLTKAQVLELISHAVELELGLAVEVKYDVQIPELATGNPRQVDSAIYTTGSGRRFLRIVEVRDRITKVGPQFVDEIAGKANAVGAHRATLVSSAGFTKGALAKLRQEHSSLIDARVLRVGLPEEWPALVEMQSMSLGIGDAGQRIAAPLIHRRYLDPLTGKIEFDILYANFSTPDASQVVCFLINPEKEPPGLVSTIALGRMRELIRDSVLTVNTTKPSGEKVQIREVAKPFSL